MKLNLIFLFAFIGFVSFAQVNQVDSKGRKQGKWEKVHPGTRVFMSRGEFKDNKPVGKFVYFYKSSKTKAVVNHNALRTGRSVAYLYHESTGKAMSIGIYSNLKKDSVWQNFTPSGRLSNTETYKDDKLDGIKKIYFVPEDPSDKSRIVATIMTYKAGELHGEYKEYFLSKKIKVRGNYTNNKQTGAWEEFHINGQRAATYRYDAGRKHGYAIAYDTKGARLGEAFYYYGRRLDGKPLEDMLKEIEKKGMNPYTMTTK